MTSGRPVSAAKVLTSSIDSHTRETGTGSPEPGGLSVPELIEIVRLLGAASVIGGDLVEVAHAWDPTARTGIAASWVIREALLTWWGK